MLTDNLWDRCLQKLEGELSDRDVSTWLRPLRAVLSAEQLNLYAPNRLVMDRVRSDFLPLIERAVASTSEISLPVHLSVGDGGATERPASSGVPKS